MARSECAYYLHTLAADLSWRETLTQTEVPVADWQQPHFGDWGPPAAWFPPVHSPRGYPETEWLRDRVVEVSKRYLGLSYTRSHIPQNGGLDCSNFTAWVFNFGAGIRIPTNVQRQAQTAGRQLDAGEPLAPGDLIYLWNQDATRITHVALYVDEDHVIDSTRDQGVRVNRRRARYLKRYAWARRIFE